MKKTVFNIIFAIMILGFISVGCASPKADNNISAKADHDTPVEFDASYNKVWDAVLTSANELKWDILNTSKQDGLIQFKDSYVYSPSERNYTRTYSVPSSDQLKNSDIIPYVESLADLKDEDEKGIFTKEALQIKINEVDATKSAVVVDYDIWKASEAGSYENLSTKGSYENRLYSRIERILGGIEEVDTVVSRDIFSESVGLYDIFFDFNSYEIREDAKPVLSQNAEILLDDPELNVVIFSYADTRGSDVYNALLAKKRSVATKRFLVSKGVSPKRLITLTRGETTKFAYGETENQYQLNRRSHMIAIKALAPPLEIAK